MRNSQFINILSDWESSAHDNRVLRDALSRRNPLKVPQDNNIGFLSIHTLIKDYIFYIIIC